MSQPHLVAWYLENGRGPYYLVVADSDGYQHRIPVDRADYSILLDDFGDYAKIVFDKWWRKNHAA